MALNLTHPLKKGTYRKIRGYASHVKYNPGTWYGDDDGCVVGTQGRAEEAGKISHAVKQKTGGGWNFRLNFTKYKGYFSWHAHNSQIPRNGQIFKRGQNMFKTGKSGGVTGPHLHHSIIRVVNNRFVVINLDNNNVIKWGEVDDMYKESPKKYSDGKSRSAKSWFNAFVTEFNRKTNARKERDSALVKVNNLSTIVSQQASQLKTLAGQVKNLQDVLKELPTQQQIDNLRKELKACQEMAKMPPRGPEKPKKYIIKPTDSWYTKLWKTVLNG